MKPSKNQTLDPKELLCIQIDTDNTSSIMKSLSINRISIFTIDERMVSFGIKKIEINGKPRMIGGYVNIYLE